jgi:hypothetical protein
MHLLAASFLLPNFLQYLLHEVVLMNMQKVFNFNLLAVFFALLSSLLVACNDPCKDIECENGTCSNGECVCSTGYSGTNCGTAINSRFDGVFVLTENCIVGQNVPPYNVTLAPKTTGPSDFTILGLWQAPQNLVTAVIDDNGTSFTIERQAIMTGYEVEAAVGTISSDANTVNLTYTIYETGDTAVVDQCTATLQK